MFSRLIPSIRVPSWLVFCLGRQDVLLTIVMLIAIIMMILPMPTFLVDVLIAVNIAFSIMLLLTAIYLNDPLELSAFPAMLLITTLYRLALTVSTSRLVLLQHDAGSIVDAFGHFVVGDNLAVGLVIFCVIAIVQFIVITKGAERVAEVSARFSLDGMPGKQMSIDGDLRTGVIDAEQAKQQRQYVQQESRFLGAMDGAMKFVKGDAIASIVVILVNIIGGILIGILQHNMSFSEAIQTYSVLSIGDGLCAQIPSLLISLSAGIIVTRIPGEKQQNLAGQLSVQLSKQPRALLMTAVVLMLFALVPRFPFFDFALLALLLSVPFFIMRARRAPEKRENNTELPSKESSMTPGACPLSVNITEGLFNGRLEEKIAALRWALFEHSGVPVPEVTLNIIRHSPQSNAMSLQLYQEKVFHLDFPEPNTPFVLGNMSMTDADPVTLPGGIGQMYWLTPLASEKAKKCGLTVYEDEARIIALLEKLLYRHMSEFIGVQETCYLMSMMEKRYLELVKELQRQMPIGKIAEIMQRLVAENVSIRDLRLIFGTLIEWSPREKDPLMLTEYVRVAMRRHILNRLKPNDLPLQALRIGENMENLIRESIRQTSMGTYCALSHEQKWRIVSLITNILKEMPELRVVTSIDTRRFLRHMLENTLFDVAVLSWQELGDDCEIEIVNSIDLYNEDSDDEV